MRAIILDETLDVSQRAAHVLSARGVRVVFAGSPGELDLVLAKSQPADVLLINVTGELSGLELAEQLRRARFSGRTLALADHLDRPDLAYLGQLPRTTCVVRPQSTALMDDFLQTAMSAPPNGHRASPDHRSHTAFNTIVGRSKPMLEIFARIAKVASGDANVCIYGESGTGKELIARAIHDASPRRENPFVALDCTAIPEGLMESYLFGHVKGAFTGAIDNREGVFSLAHTGTLFMDELWDLSLPLQAKLLRVVQTREYFKVGGTKPVRSNVRLITATNKDPKQEMERGHFRQDLYYRVTVVVIKVPPLRERKEDIPLLIEHFITKFSGAYNKPIREIEPAAMDRLLACPWPGNVRQLEHFLEQAVVLADSENLTERELFPEDSAAASVVPPSGVKFELGLPMREVERRYILRTLQAVQGNRTEAARRLGVSVRCLQYKLKRYSIDAAVNGDRPINGDRPRVIDAGKGQSRLTAGVS